VPIKRVDVLLEAFARAREGAPLRLLLVGDGEERAALESLAHRLGIADAVSFLGYRTDLDRVQAAADIAVLSSDNEGTPVSLIEAAAAARPAVATSVGGVADVVRPETGILVPPGDADALAAAIGTLAADPELRRRLGAAARDHALARYSAERLIGDVDALYRELLSTAGRGG
jgi:glycosyltransferase involved in cell wall biosynthesis